MITNGSKRGLVKTRLFVRDLNLSHQNKETVLFTIDSVDPHYGSFNCIPSQERTQKDSQWLQFWPSPEATLCPPFPGVGWSTYGISKGPLSETGLC